LVCTQLEALYKIKSGCEEHLINAFKFNLVPNTPKSKFSGTPEAHWVSLQHFPRHPSYGERACCGEGARCPFAEPPQEPHPTLSPSDLKLWPFRPGRFV